MGIHLYCTFFTYHTVWVHNFEKNLIIHDFQEELWYSTPDFDVKFHNECNFNHRNYLYLLFCAIFKIWKQNLPLKCTISDVFYPMFTNWVHTKTMFVHVSEREIFFPLNYSTFVVEGDWNSKNSQNVQNLDFFGKMDVFFWKKTLKFFKIATCGKFFLERVSNGIFFLENVFPLYFWGFYGKNLKKTKVGKVRQNDEESEYFEKQKTLSSL